jgi:hypothetical protein
VRTGGQPMIVRVSTFLVTFVVALIGIFLHVNQLWVKIVLAALAGASFLLAIFIEIKASREADFTKRSLERLIQASTPSDRFANTVTQIALKEASKRSLSNSFVGHREQDDGYTIVIVFTDKGEREAEGYFQFDHEQLAQWSLLEEKKLSDAIAADMFTRGPAPTEDLLENWNELVAFIGEVGKGLYPDSFHNGAFGVSANIDTVEIGLPYPLSVPIAVPGGTRETRELPLGGESVPFLMFSKQDLTDLVAQSNIAASRTIAGWLAAAWGTPTVLRSAGRPPAPNSAGRATPRSG